MLVGQIAAVSIAVVGMVVAQILVLSGARGQARLLDSLGTALIVLGLVARFAIQWMAQWFFARVDNDTFVFVLAADTVADAVLTGAGVLLVSRSMVVAGWPMWTDRHRRELLQHLPGH